MLIYYDNTLVLNKINNITTVCAMAIISERVACKVILSGRSN